ncbi:HAD family phosphatase [Hydrogenophaga aromaticivorans]|uniref:HAD family hydrolase n=1 Tax=Hydrogenophaga aromaticivorans TaxID=2610898 RepID=UPI001B365F16|nr:HAD family phosphatase [Hydrogenophaga aromaticivorans]MBQ0917422.1 HAD family phosphatase [Hydrogenophaga aromaticivorans]
MSPQKTVIFDLGGVLLHWQPLTLLQHLLPRHAPHHAGAQALAQQLFQGFDPGGDWALFDLGQIDPDALAQRIAARTGLQVQDVQAVIEAIPPHLATLEGTEALLHELRAQGHRLCFLSNMPAPYAERLLRDKAFFSAFDDGIFSAHVQQIKPDPGIYALAVERFGLGADEVWFIDDVQRNLDAAHAHGWRGVRFESALQVRAQLVEAGLLPI